MIKTHEAMDAYILASDIAVRFGAGYVGTEHLVFTLMTGDCMTARIFTGETAAETFAVCTAVLLFPFLFFFKKLF